MRPSPYLRMSLLTTLVAAAREERVELALVLVLRIEPGVGVRAHEVAPGGRRPQQGHVVDVDACGLGRIEDVRDIDEHGDVLAHADLLWMAARATRASRERVLVADGGARVERRRLGVSDG